MIGDSYRAQFESRPFPHWQHEFSGVSVRFGGRIPNGEELTLDEALRRFDGAPRHLAWLDQCHSSGVRRASAAGACGRGDGIWTKRPGLALSIVTADCVPVVCGCDQAVAAIHAGWRGLVAGVIRATLGELPAPTSELEAWLGPAIGPCCYEVGHDVAALVTSSSDSSAAALDGAGRPHLDLHRAAEIQLRNLGVRRVYRVEACTRCDSDVLWSYRGSSGTRGRNHTFAWLSG